MADRGPAVLAFLLAGVLAHSKLRREGENGEEAEGDSGRRSLASEGPCDVRNLGGDEMAGGSSMSGGVRRCRVDEDRQNGFVSTRGSSWWC